MPPIEASENTVSVMFITAGLITDKEIYHTLY